MDRATNPAANPAWFQEAKLNWAENMLHCRSTEKVALIQAGALISFHSDVLDNIGIVSS